MPFHSLQPRPEIVRKAGDCRISVGLRFVGDGKIKNGMLTDGVIPCLTLLLH